MKAIDSIQVGVIPLHKIIKNHCPSNFGIKIDLCKGERKQCKTNQCMRCWNQEIKGNK